MASLYYSKVSIIQNINPGFSSKVKLIQQGLFKKTEKYAKYLRKISIQKY